MRVIKTARYRVQPEARQQVLAAIREFVGYVRQNELETELYAAFRERENPDTFLHVMIFRDETAEERHRTSAGTGRFAEVLYHRTVAGVTFTDYEEVGDH